MQEQRGTQVPQTSDAAPGRLPGWAPAVVVALFATGWFALMGGFNVVAPTNIDWMFNGDWAGHFFCAAFTRNGPWGLPFDQAPDLMYPYGSSAAYGDCNPIMMLVVKVLSPLLPLRVQTFGLWSLLCLITIGLVGQRVLRGWTRDPVLLALGGMLFVANPLIAWRSGHTQFFAQFPLLGLCGLGFYPLTEARQARRLALAAIALGCFTCGVNAYLGVMGAALMVGVLARLTLTPTLLSMRERLLWPVVGAVAAVGTLWLFGYLSGLDKPLSQMTAEGFGQFSNDLGSLWNPIDRSRVIPGLPLFPRQGEGYAYLGLGVLLLLVGSLATLAASKAARALVPGRQWWLERAPLLVIVLGAACYSASSIVTIHTHKLFDLSGFYSHFGSIIDVFRVSGRFIWPTHALLTFTAALAPLVGALGGSLARARGLLAAAVLVQAFDVDLTKSSFHGPFRAFEPLPSKIWDEAPNGYRHFVIHPIMAQWTCPYDEGLVAKISWEAYRHHLSINSGLVGRNPPEVKAACLKHFTEAQLDPESIYVVYYREFLADFLGHGYTCGVLDSLVVCVSAAKETPFLAELRAHPLPAELLTP